MEVIILSGGNSSRMHTPKAFLRINGITLLEKLCDVYIEAGIEKPVIVLNHNIINKEWENTIEKIETKATVIKNTFPEKGRTYSIKLGIDAINKIDNCYIQNIDNPEVNINLLKKMSDKLIENGYVVPLMNKIGGHPILLHKNIIKHLFIKKTDDWILKNELKSFDRIEIDALGTNVTWNLNTPTDWENYLKSLQKRTTEI